MGSGLGKFLGFGFGRGKFNSLCRKLKTILHLRRIRAALTKIPRTFTRFAARDKAPKSSKISNGVCEIQTKRVILHFFSGGGWEKKWIITHLVGISQTPWERIPADFGAFSRAAKFVKVRGIFVRAAVVRPKWRIVFSSLQRELDFRAQSARKCKKCKNYKKV